MSPMEKTEHLTLAFRRQHDILAERVTALEDEVEKLKRRRMPGIRSAVQSAAQARAELAAHIERHPDLFEKPRTVVVAGVRVGLMKGKGQIVWDSPAQVVRMIRKHFPDQADALVKVTETPVKKALANLTTAELKKLGARVEETGDAVVIKPVDGDVDRLVAALLTEAEQWEVAA